MERHFHAGDVAGHIPIIIMTQHWAGFYAGEQRIPDIPHGNQLGIADIGVIGSKQLIHQECRNVKRKFLAGIVAICIAERFHGKPSIRVKQVRVSQQFLCHLIQENIVGLNLCHSRTDRIEHIQFMLHEFLGRQQQGARSFFHLRDIRISIYRIEKIILHGKVARQLDQKFQLIYRFRGHLQGPICYTDGGSKLIQNGIGGALECVSPNQVSGNIGGTNAVIDQRHGCIHFGLFHNPFFQLVIQQSCHIRQYFRTALHRKVFAQKPRGSIKAPMITGVSIQCRKVQSMVKKSGKGALHKSLIRIIIRQQIRICRLGPDGNGGAKHTQDAYREGQRHDAVFQFSGTSCGSN